MPSRAQFYDQLTEALKEHYERVVWEYAPNWQSGEKRGTLFIQALADTPDGVTERPLESTVLVMELRATAEDSTILNDAFELNLLKQADKIYELTVHDKLGIANKFIEPRPDQWGVVYDEGDDGVRYAIMSVGYWLNLQEGR